MDKLRFDQFLARQRRQLANFSRQQVASTKETFTAHALRWLCLEPIEAFARLRKVCPYCPSQRFHRHDYAAGLQCYRCVGYGHTFNALTGTPLARLRRRECWLSYLQLMLDSKTVSAGAKHACIHRNTGFRLRHRF